MSDLALLSDGDLRSLVMQYQRELARRREKSQADARLMRGEAKVKSQREIDAQRRERRSGIILARLRGQSRYDVARLYGLAPSTVAAYFDAFKRRVADRFWRRKIMSLPQCRYTKELVDYIDANFPMSESEL